jgi:chemotaxis protein CheZ
MSFDVTEFKTLRRDIDVLLTHNRKKETKIHGLMTDVLMAQDFQDLTGQIIRKVIDLVCVLMKRRTKNAQRH